MSKPTSASSRRAKNRPAVRKTRGAGFWGVPAGCAAPNFNIANLLTVLRLVLVPVFVCLMLLPGVALRWGALVVFAAASLTDKLDGTLARGLNLVTDFGKLADPIADKSLVLVAFILISLQPGLWWMWIVTAVVLARELGITLMRLAMVKIAVMPASRGGKLKTVVQMLLIVVLLVPWRVLVPGWWTGILAVAAAIAVVATVITVGTGLAYVAEAVSLCRKARSRTESGKV